MMLTTTLDRNMAVRGKLSAVACGSLAVACMTLALGVVGRQVASVLWS
jgi:hypothetical protein